jgi:SAM-dependent methyltransferase
VSLEGPRRRVGWLLTSLGRWRVARGCLRGRGMELGALHSPFPVPRRVHVTYLDHLPVAGLRLHYPELAQLALVPVDVVDDAETLATVADSSQDFVIASHLLEHCEDPIGALGHWLRVVRLGGVVLVAVPDQRFTFDSTRPVTSLGHLVRDHSEGPAASRSSHYREWALRVEGVAAEHVAARAAELEASGYRIHFHAWNFDALAELLEHCAARFGGARILRLRRNRHENLAVLRRTGPSR